MLGLSRTFDPSQDEHPVRWVLENLKEAIYQPWHQWLCEMAGRDVIKAKAKAKAVTKKRKTAATKDALLQLGIRSFT